MPCLTILPHLWTAYRELQDAEVQENDQQIKAPITSETLFENLIQQIEVAVDAVASQVPYTAAQIVSIALTLIEQLGTYYDGVKEWQQKCTADKTWVAFKDFFAQEFREVRVVTRTKQSERLAQYFLEDGKANAATLTSMQTTQTSALSNIATATASNRHAVTLLTTTNATLTAHLQTENATIATLQTCING